PDLLRELIAETCPCLLHPKTIARITVRTPDARAYRVEDAATELVGAGVPEAIVESPRGCVARVQTGNNPPRLRLPAGEDGADHLGGEQDRAPSNGPSYSIDTRVEVRRSS